MTFSTRLEVNYSMEHFLDNANKYKYFQVSINEDLRSGISLVNDYLWELLIELDGSRRVSDVWSSQSCLLEASNFSNDGLDFFSLSGIDSLPVLSNKALDSLEDSVTASGELLELNNCGKSFWIFNCTNVIDLVNIDKSDIEFSEAVTIIWTDEIIIDIEKSIPKDISIFRLKHIEKHGVYISEEVKDKIIEKDLQGIVLTPIQVA